MSELLKLVVGHNERSEAVVPVRWCLTDADVASEINSKRMAWILISVVHETAGEVGRYFIPLKRLMDYIQFNRPGKHTLYASVFYTDLKETDVNYAGIRQLVLAKERETSSVFSIKVFDTLDGKVTSFRPMWLTNELNKNTTIRSNILQAGECSSEVIVPDGFFAKERPKWLVRWAHLVWKRPYIDDCDFRKHVIFAFTLQPVLVLIISVIGLLSAVFYTLLKALRAMWAILLGVRICTKKCARWDMVDLRAVFDLSKDLDDVWSGEFHESYARYSKDGISRSGFFLLLAPITTVLLSELGLVVRFYFGSSSLSWEGLKWAIVFGIATALILAIIFGLLELLMARYDKALRKRWGKSPKELREERERNRQLRKEEEERLALAAELKPLVCDLMPFEANVTALPSERRTLYLRFVDLKAKVCRPRALG